MKRIKAGALYYAIFISFFIALVSGFLILQHWYQQYYILYVQNGERLQRDIRSAIMVVTENPSNYESNKKFLLDLYDDSLNVAEISKTWWGGYQLIRADASWRVIQRSDIFLVGIETLPQDAVALYLADEGKYLSIAGETKITGNCFLPKLGIRKAYIEGSGYMGDKLVKGNIKESKLSLPPYDENFLNNNQLKKQDELSENDSIADIGLFLHSASLNNSFYNKTLRFNTAQWLTLENQNLKGNIKIISQSGITIKKTTVLQDVILYAPKIEIEDDFTGSLQCFVTDTLLIGEDCILKFPTLLALNETAVEKPLVKIGENTTVLGDIVVIAKSEKENTKPECSIAKDVVINGSVYCEGKINIEGTVKGQIFCKGFVLRTASSVYENHLLNATLNSSQLSPYYCGSMFMTSNKHQKVIKCLE